MGGRIRVGAFEILSGVDESNIMLREFLFCDDKDFYNFLGEFNMLVGRWKDKKSNNGSRVLIEVSEKILRKDSDGSESGRDKS